MFWVTTAASRPRRSSSTVALTGAGISVPSGIPDFRTPGEGIWSNVDPFEVASIDAFRRDPQRFWQFYRPRFSMLGDKRPNPAHVALATLEGRGLLAAVVTQNIDRLHRAAGTRELIEVHGSIAATGSISPNRTTSGLTRPGQISQTAIPRPSKSASTSSSP